MTLKELGRNVLPSLIPGRVWLRLIVGANYAMIRGMSNNLAQNTTGWFPSACRAARGWLGWSAAELAAHTGTLAGVSVSHRQIQRVEAGARTSDMVLAAITETFLAAGIEISGQGIRMVDKG